MRFCLPTPSGPSRFTSRLVPAIAVSTLVGSLLAGCVGAPSASMSPTAAESASSAFHPITLDNCGRRITITRPATRVVTINQGATENVLALGLERQLVGTAYRDGAIPSKWQKAYDSVKVIAKEEPDKETLLATNPDFVLASWSSAFTDKSAGTREELAAKGIGTYLSPFGCPEGVKQAATTWDSVHQELRDVGAILGRPDRARAAIADQDRTVRAVRTQAHGKGRKVLWYDSGDKSPFLGGGTGGPQLIMDATGATNVFATQKKNWFTGTWEKVIASDPDVIVLADASWDTAAHKIKHLESDPVLRTMRAVRARAYVVVPFSATTPGAELADGARIVSEGLAKVRR